MSYIFITSYIFIKSIYASEKDYMQWLPEQTCTAFYLCFLLLSLNPISFVMFISSVNYLPTLIYYGIIISLFGSRGLWTIWLCYSAPVLYRQCTPLTFYIARILFSLTSFICGVIIFTANYSYLVNNSDANVYGYTNELPTIDTDIYFVFLIILEWIFYLLL